MKGRNLYPFVTLLISLVLIATCQAATTVTTQGEAAVANITPEQAQQLALQRARQEAIAKVCGVQIQAETLMENFTLQGDFIHGVSYGRIIDEQIMAWQVTVDQPRKTKAPELTYKVTLRAKVEEEKGKPDPFYKVKVWLNKSIFENGEEMTINIKASKDGYITVLDFAADGSVTLLFPNKLRPDNKIEANKTIQIPSPQDRRQLLTFQVGTLPGHKQDTEAIKVIATRGPINLLAEVESQGNYGVMNSTKFALTEIARLLSTIPPNARTEDSAVYQVINPRLQ